MGRKKIYEEVKGYWVYSIKIPSNNKYYVGVSKRQCSHRWRKSKYKDNSLAPYLNEWDSLIKTVIKDGLTKTEALKMEDDLIQALRFIDLCINERRSGLIKVSDTNAYQKELYKNNQEHKKQLYKQWYERNKERINENRRQRYENDIEYREKVNQQNKQYREDNPEYEKQRYQKKKLEKQQNHTVVD